MNKPQGEVPGISPCGLPGVFAFIEPAVRFELKLDQESLSLLMEAVPSRTLTRPSVQTPNRHASVSGCVAWSLPAITPRLPTLRPGFHSRSMPGFPCCRCHFVSRHSAPRSARKPQQRSDVFASSDLAAFSRSLTRWQSGSSPPTRAVSGFSWTSPLT